MSAPSEEPPRLQSNLPTARERFLARVVDQAFDDGWRTAEDFLRHFPPQTIVQSLAKADDLRVKLLVETTGANERLALKKSVASASEDLNLALEEDLTTPTAILALYPADDKVRYLPADALWSFYSEDAFFDTNKTTDASKHAHATKRLTFALEVALDEKLITLRDIADGITFDEIAERLPVEDLRELLKHAMKLARTDLALVEEEFHNVVPLGTLTGYVPLAHTWERVVIDKVAAPAGFCERVSSVPPKAASDEKTTAPEDAKPAVKAATAPKPLPPPPAPPAAAPAPEAPSEVDAEPPPLPAEPTAAADELLGGPTTVERPAEEDAARRRVLDRLTAIERLPPSSAELATPILLSIESMYADLASGASDDEREAVVEEAFPNETHLRTAMLALIELLDPSVDTSDPVIRDADPKSLVKIVLFEERRRSEPRRSSPGGAPVSQAAPNSKRRSVPPLPPRTSSAPPPPRQSSRRAK